MPVSTDVTAIFSASAASTLLSAGTGSATGAVAAVPPVAAEPLTVRVVVAAFAADEIIIVLVRAAAMTSEIFLNEFITLFLLIVVFVLWICPQNSIILE